jgi:hypothetical protein
MRDENFLQLRNDEMIAKKVRERKKVTKKLKCGKRRKKIKNKNDLTVERERKKEGNK